MSIAPSRLGKRTLLAASLLGAALFGSATDACTTLSVSDTKGGVYFGRTLEMALDLPYEVTYFPAGREIDSTHAESTTGLRYRTKHHLLAVTVPLASPTDLKVVEGLNEEGLTFSALAFPAVGPEGDPDGTRKALAAIDLGSWALGQFTTTAAVKAALEAEPAILNALSVMGNAKIPVHYVLHDRSGAGIVVEYVGGKQTIYDNPVNVMTNGPTFPWHLTNLGNYSFLTNVDNSQGTFGSFKAVSPGSGVATAGLPAANTSVGRFVRAAFYSQYAKRAETPNGAVRTLAHVMNNFDRPVDITVDPASSPLASAGAVGAMLAESKDASTITSESTKWTSISDLNRVRFYVRPQDAMNYTVFDLKKLARAKEIESIPLDKLDGTAPDGVGLF